MYKTTENSSEHLSNSYTKLLFLGTVPRSSLTNCSMLDKSGTDLGGMQTDELTDKDGGEPRCWTGREEDAIDNGSKSA